MSLQDLPPELIERVVVLLTLSDISSLRLTNRCLASKSAQRHLKASFRAKTVELTEQRLRLFVAVTASGSLGCLIQDLTLIAPVYNTLELTARIEEKTAKIAELDENGRFRRMGRKDLTAEAMRQTELDLVVLQHRLDEQLDLERRQRDVELLRQAFSNLATRGASLRKLRTEVVIYKDNTTTPLLPLFGGSEKLIWASAVHLSRTLFVSLVACDLHIQGLDLFNSMRMLRCSLSYDGLNSVDFASGRLGMSVGHLAELSWSISDKIIDQSPDEKSSEEVINESRLHGLRSLLQTCSSIRKLDLTYFSTAHGDRTNAQCGHILRALDESSLRCLQHLTLQGFKATEHELLALLHNCGALRSLSLRYVQLKDGSFKPILDYCTLDAAMEELELDSLFEPDTHEFECDVIQFEPPWVAQNSNPETPPAGYPDSRASYRRPPNDAESYHIRHYRYQGRTLDSISMKAWRQDLRNQFGPLPKNGKPSCLQPYVPPERLWRYR
jgi:hypothetical protein